MKTVCFIFLISFCTVVLSVDPHNVIVQLLGNYEEIPLGAFNVTSPLLVKYGDKKAKSKDFEKFKEASQHYVNKVNLLLKKLKSHNIGSRDKHYIHLKNIVDGMNNLQDIEKDDRKKGMKRIKAFHATVRDMYQYFYLKYSDSDSY
uniref:Uncharacterized protein n=1 Tax=Clastoptera arizonana TaxID=38151 RepID=A0A1B6DU09_9HEMI